MNKQLHLQNHCVIIITIIMQDAFIMHYLYKVHSMLLVSQKNSCVTRLLKTMWKCIVLYRVCPSVKTLHYRSFVRAAKGMNTYLLQFNDI